MLISLKLKVFFLFTFLFGTCKSDYAIYNIPTSTLESSKSLSTTTKAKNIALTFDDGPHGILTPKLLDILNETNSKATFFIMGVKAHLHPNVLRRMVTEGHEIGNHGWNHPVMSKLTHDQVHQQLATTANAIQNVTDTTPTNMRPPYGNTNNKLNRYIAVKEKLGVIMWSLDTLDWQRPSPDTIGMCIFIFTFVFICIFIKSFVQVLVFNTYSYNEQICQRIF